MCGIFFSLSRDNYVTPDSRTEHLLKNRGPDSIGIDQVLIPSSREGEAQPTQFNATFLSTVLSLRGSKIVSQPLKDHISGSVLCWNGEAWSFGRDSITENDSQTIFDLFLTTCSENTNRNRDSRLRRFLEVSADIRGPYAFVFYDATNQYLIFGRDCLGRRSLLRKETTNNELILSSVCDNATGECWAEVEADGLYMLDLQQLSEQSLPPIVHVPQNRQGDSLGRKLSLSLPFPSLNNAIAGPDACSGTENLQHVREALQASLNLRIRHVREAIKPIASASAKSEARVAILFSGGLDCTILARLSHDLLPLDESVDLLNVAFENPRIHGKLGTEVSPYELCPDRITGRSSFAELIKVCAGRRWQLVCINVPYTDTVAHREHVISLMHPHNTEMDLSISYALYFASRGIGAIHNALGSPSSSYTTPAHVLLSGLGADELFGGYQRHAAAYSRQGYPGLIEELKLDFNRLGKRNLGRDDRVISDSGKEVRFPYLDENFVALALELPVQAKCDFANSQSEDSDDPGRFLEPAKRILRLLAWEFGMKGVAAEKKRAIQFGSRTAKMETGKTKGTQVLS